MLLLGQSVEGEGPPAAEVVRLVGKQRRRDDWRGYGARSPERAERMNKVEAGRDPLQHALLNQFGGDHSGVMTKELPQLGERDATLALALPRSEEA